MNQQQDKQAPKPAGGARPGRRDEDDGRPSRDNRGNRIQESD